MRLEYYEKRKATKLNSSIYTVQKAQLEKLELDLWKVANRVRFIRGIIHGDIIFINRKTEDLVLELHKRDSLHSRTKMSLEAGQAGTEGDYKYLLLMPISNLTQEKVQELCNEKCKLEHKRWNHGFFIGSNFLPGVAGMADNRQISVDFG